MNDSPAENHCPADGPSPYQADSADADGVDVALELDCRDMLCPMPVIELARHHTDVEVGQVVAVVATDAAARVDVPAWCRMKGQEFLGEDSTEDQVPRYLVLRRS